MRKLFIACIGCCLLNSVEAQVRIGGIPNTADPSAILELDGGTSRGFLFPRMRKMDMLAIPLPAEGLTVYVTDEQCIYLRRSGNWVKISGSGDVFSLPYAGLFNVPTPVLQLTNTGGLTTMEISNPAAIAINGVTGSGEAIKGNAEANGVAGVFQNQSSSGVALLAFGKVGFGTNNPDGPLHVRGANTPGFTLTLDDDADPTLQLQLNGISKGFLQVVGDDMKIGTNATNDNGNLILRTNGADRLFVDNTGQIGIGAASTGARFHVDALNSSATAMTINDQNPTLQLQNSGIDKGFLQLNGDDIRLGTNNANTEGQIILRTGGLDQIMIDHDGRMGINTEPGLGGASALSIFASPNAGEGNIELRSSYAWNYGPVMRFRGTSPVHKPLGFIEINDNDMHLRSGTVGSTGFRFSIQEDDVMRINTSFNAGFVNRLGVGTFSPSALLHVDGNTANLTGEVARFSGSNPLIQIQNVSENIGFIQAAAQSIRIGTNAGNDVGQFIVRMNGTNRVWVDQLGNMSIGPDMYNAPPANDYKLAVKGKIAGTEFVVRSLATWPDYVFDPSYKLMALPEVEAFIKEHKHLPNILPAAEVEKNGFGLADMQKRMMEKIEELTLHLIDADKKIKELTEKIDKLESR